MSRLAAFMRWLGTPIRETRKLFPFSSDGRTTLVYLVFAGAGPALTLAAMRILDDTKGKHWDTYASTAEKLGWALLIAVAALGTYVAWRSIKIGRDGLSADAKGEAPVAAQKVADAAQQTADEIKETEHGTDQ